MNAPRVDPNEVPRSLEESVHRNLGLHQVFHIWPPHPLKVVHRVLLAEVVQGAPVVLWHPKPFAVTRADVQVDGAEVVLLLVRHGSGAGDLHRHPDGVHPNQLVTKVGEHVSSRHYSGPMWKFHQLL